MSDDTPNPASASDFARHLRIVQRATAEAEVNSIVALVMVERLAILAAKNQDDLETFLDELQRHTKARIVPPDQASEAIFPANAMKKRIEAVMGFVRAATRARG